MKKITIQLSEESIKTAIKDLKPEHYFLCCYKGEVK